MTPCPFCGYPILTPWVPPERDQVLHCLWCGASYRQELPILRMPQRPLAECEAHRKPNGDPAPRWNYDPTQPGLHKEAA